MIRMKKADIARRKCLSYRWFTIFYSSNKWKI